MQILWKIKRGVVWDVIKRMKKPSLHYNTVSSMVRGLETKGYLAHKAYGKTHEYFPIIMKNDYKVYLINEIISNYFNSSSKELISFVINSKTLLELTTENGKN